MKKYNEREKRLLIQLFNELHRSFHAYAKRKDACSYTQLLTDYKSFYKFFKHNPENEVKCLYIMFSINKFLL